MGSSSAVAQKEKEQQKRKTQQYPLWKEESIPDLINDDEDINLLADRNYETLLDYGGPDEPQSYQQ